MLAKTRINRGLITQRVHAEVGASGARFCARFWFVVTMCAARADRNAVVCDCLEPGSTNSATGPIARRQKPAVANTVAGTRRTCCDGRGKLCAFQARIWPRCRFEGVQGTSFALT